MQHHCVQCWSEETYYLAISMNENIPLKLKHLSSQEFFLDTEETEPAHTEKQYI